MIRALIADDEQLARAGLRVLLAEEPDAVIVGECGDGAEAVAAIRDERPDVLFLDVQMPHLDGFEVLAALSPEEVPATVFVTAFDEHALRAFEANAIDYLLKPFDRDRFAQSFRRVKRFLDGDQLTAFRSSIRAVLGAVGQASTSSLAGRDARLILRDRDRVTFVSMADIDYVVSTASHVQVWAAGTRHVARESLPSLERRLDTTRFLRVSRSTLVNLDRVREVRRLDDGRHLVVMRDGKTISASRRYGRRVLRDEGR